MSIDKLNGQDFAFYWRILSADQKRKLSEESGVDYKHLSRIANQGGAGWSTIQALVKADENINFEMFGDNHNEF